MRLIRTSKLGRKGGGATLNSPLAEKESVALSESANAVVGDEIVSIHRAKLKGEAEVSGTGAGTAIKYITTTKYSLNFYTNEEIKTTICQFRVDSFMIGK